LLKGAELGKPLSEQRFVALQNAVVEDRRAEASYRLHQNWLGEDFGYRRQVDFVPPRPEDVRPLMEGLVAMSERVRAHPGAIDPVVAASAIAFGFVFIHPFGDGNGRLHRYMIHEHLATADFTPKGVILPVSAVILANLDRYKAALERTVEHDVDEEISFLLGFDRARKTLDGAVDWPAHSLDLFIRVVKQNGFRLSATKRASHFDWMTDDEVGRFERAVERAFSKDVELDDILVV
jgi:Fic family protein